MTTTLAVAVPVVLLAAAELPGVAVGLCGVGVLTAVTAYTARRRNRGEPAADQSQDGSDTITTDPTVSDSPADVSAGHESDACRTTDDDPVDATPPDTRPGVVAGRACRRSD